MKNIALFIIAVCTALIGSAAASAFEKRVSALEKICILLNSIKTRVEFDAQSAGDIFFNLCADGEFSSLPFVRECDSLLKSGVGFCEAWEKSLKNYENTRFLKKGDVAVLLSFGSLFGATDIPGQIANCELHISLIEQKLNSAREEAAKYSKPVRGIGFLAGAAVYILFM